MYNVIQYHNVSFYAEKTHISYVDKILDEEYTHKAWWPSPSRSVPRVHGTMSRQWSHTHVPVLQGRYSTQLSHEREVNTLSSCGYYILRRKASRYISSAVHRTKVHGLGFSLGIVVMIPEYFHINLLSCWTAFNPNPALNAVVNMSNVKWSFSLALKSNFWDLQTLLLESLALLSNLTVCYINPS